MDLVTLHIDDTEVQAPSGTTVLEAAQSFDIAIPTLCSHPDFTASGRCRVCVVEVDGYAQLLPSCRLMVEQGMVVKTQTSKVIASRRMSVELLVAQHPMQCLTCYRNGKCQLQELAKQFGIHGSRFSRRETVVSDGKPDYPRLPLDDKSPAILHDPNLCVLCGLCIDACRTVQQVDVIDFAYRGCRRHIEPAFGQSLHDVECTACGQCIQVCPVNAFAEKSDLTSVQSALQDPELHVVGLLSPMVGLSLGEECGLEPGTRLNQQLVGALKTAGFENVFDVSVGVDVVLLEEAYQLLARIKSGKRLPMISSSSPAWVKYVEHFYPNMLPLLSSCKSPAQALASLVKMYYAPKNGLSPEQVFVVSLTPCTAEKFERMRPEMTMNGEVMLDACLTTKETASLLSGSIAGKLHELPPQPFDPPFDAASGAGMIFCAAGGMLEGVMRTFYELFAERKLKTPEFTSMRDSDGFKDITIKAGQEEIHGAIVHGTGNVGRLLEKITKDKKQYHYVEVKGCPQGCAHGGGQPLPWNDDILRARWEALYGLDSEQDVRKAHENPSVKRLYEEFLKKPSSNEAKKVLYTTFTQRQRYL